jgi:SWI/SNF-related matrix-associated actin-dependent regulator of chromatin subfamily A3
MNTAKYTKTFLHQELEKYNIDIKGKKSELFNKLMEYYNEKRGKWNADIVHTDTDLNLQEKDELYLGTRYKKFDSHDLVRYVENHGNYDMYLDKNKLKHYLINGINVPTILIETIINIYSSKQEKKRKKRQVFPKSNIPFEYTKIEPQPYWIKSILYSHQREAIQWMKGLEEKILLNELTHRYKLKSSTYICYSKFDKTLMFNINDKTILIGKHRKQEYHQLHTQGGILGDNVGLGKTLSMIGLILTNNSTHPIYDKVDQLQYNYYPNCNCNLVIAPTYLVEQWSSEIFKHINPPLIHYIITNKKQHQEITYKQLLTADIIIVSDKFLRSQYYQGVSKSASFSSLQHTEQNPLSITSPVFQFIEWRRIILDESDSVLSSYINDIHSIFKWCISGTPKNSKQLSEFLGWNVISDNILPFIKSFSLIRTKSQVDINIPTYNIQTYKLQLSFFERQLYDRTKQTSIVLRQLCSTMMNDNQFKREYKNIAEFQVQLDIENQHILNNISPKIDEKTNECAYLHALLKKETEMPDSFKVQTSNEIDKLSQTIESLQKEKTDIVRTMEYQNSMISKLTTGNHECMICYTKIDSNHMSMTSCCHTYCETCIHQLSNKCSICRKIFTITPINNIQTYGSKIDKLIQYLRAIPATDKVLVFSQWTKSLHVVQKCLSEQKLNCCVFNNNATQISKLLKEFTEDTNIMLLSLTTNYSGLDLYHAQHIVFLDVLSGTYEEVHKREEQAIGRAYRIGQTNTVKIIRLVMENTIEEDVYKKLYEG